MAKRRVKLSRADLDEAILEASTALAEFGIRDKFIVKIKTPKSNDPNWIGMYRSRTQFHGHRYPIFWISDATPEIARATGWPLHKALVSTLLHEYGHVIYEWALLESPSLLEVIQRETFDEEDFAESFGSDVMNAAVAPTYRAIAAQYFAEVSQ